MISTVSPPRPPLSTKPRDTKQKALQMGPSALPACSLQKVHLGWCLLGLDFYCVLQVSLLPHKLSSRVSRSGGPDPNKTQKACYGQRFFVPVHHQAELLVHRGGNQRATNFPRPRSHRSPKAEQRWEAQRCEHLAPSAPSLRELQPTASTTDSAPKGRYRFSCAVLEQDPGLVPTGRKAVFGP